MTAQNMLADALLKAAPDKGISCEAARALAEELGISYKQLGDEANKLGIKIKSCQLGCF